MRATRLVCAAYVAACILALFLIPASARGWFGVERDPLAGVFAYLLSLPWSLVAARVAGASEFGNMVLIAAAMTLNLAIIFAVGRWLARRA